MLGSAKLSSGASSDYGSSASSGSQGSVPVSSGSSGSSSCQCAFEVTDIVLTSGTSGSYLITNTGCGEIQIFGHSPSMDTWFVGDVILSEGESTTAIVVHSADIRLTSFTVQTSCGDKTYAWPDFP